MAIVKAPLVIARDESGALVYLYAGTEVPSNIGKDELARLDEFFDSGDESKKSTRSKSE